MGVSDDVTDATTEVFFGLCLWATGSDTLDFVKSLQLKSVIRGPGRGRILIDDQLRIHDDSIPFHRDVFAIGDCAANFERPLGLLAQVANQQGKYLAAYLNRGAPLSHAPFRYTFMGSMAQLGTFDAVLESPPIIKGFSLSPKLSGLLAFLAWRSAYFTYTVSLVNKMLILMYW